MKRLPLFVCVLLISFVGMNAQNHESAVSQYLNQRNSVPIPFGTYNMKSYNQQTLWKEYPEPKFNLYFNIGGEFGDDIKGFSLDVRPGVRFNKYIFGGIESGISLPTKTTSIDAGTYSALLISDIGYAPVAVNIMGLYPIGK